MITIEQFRAMELRVGTVKSAEPHPNADRLVVLRVDLGTEERQLVAGIRAHYEPAALVGRQVVVVANLAPAKLRGVESQGMVLAASDGERVVLLAPDSAVAAGSTVR
ncbi:MAG TPA: methionine--tRNA ligase subunit beta [Candidatus Binatia bacterium]|jgi:methionyl-tRNA synthetase|nr:methionine--tRNA ligase subunit beta [Candidatus Binatia bacterium]